MTGSRFLRVAGLALWLYGVLGLGVAVAILIVGYQTFQQVASLQRTLETQRTGLVQSVRSMSTTLRDTVGATADFQRSIETARSSADQASRLANDTAGTFRNTGTSLTSLTVLGIQPLIGIQPEFDRSADQLQQLAISLGSTREALSQNGSGVGRVGADLGRLQAQLDALATTLGQPDLFGLDAAILRPFQVAVYGLCLLVGLQSVFSIIAGGVLFRLARPPVLTQPRTATTSGVPDADRVRTC